LSAPSVVPAPE
jgi:hypothetical protein